MMDEIIIDFFELRCSDRFYVIDFIVKLYLDVFAAIILAVAVYVEMFHVYILANNCYFVKSMGGAIGSDGRALRSDSAA